VKGVGRTRSDRIEREREREREIERIPRLPEEVISVASKSVSPDVRKLPDTPLASSRTDRDSNFWSPSLLNQRVEVRALAASKQRSFLRIFFSHFTATKGASPNDSVPLGPLFDFHLVPFVLLPIDWRSKVSVPRLSPSCRPFRAVTKSKTAEAIYYRVPSVTYLMKRRAPERSNSRT